MSYLTWLKTKDRLNDIVDVMYIVTKWIVSTIISIARLIIYSISSFGVAILGIFFPLGIYFCFTVLSEVFKGVPLLETSFFGFFLLFFIAPLAFAVVREIT